jgi:hypothetical protein
MVTVDVVMKAIMDITDVTNISDTRGPMNVRSINAIRPSWTHTAGKRANICQCHQGGGRGMESKKGSRKKGLKKK